MPSTAQSPPDDVIREILKYFAAPLLALIDGSAQEFPWYLGHVCSSWRVAFLSMYQEFWKKFLLYPAISRTHESEQQCADIAAAFIERSNGKPFFFELHRNARSRLVLDTFFREATLCQWQDVSFAIEEEEISILESTKGRFSQLHSLTLVVTPADWAVEELKRPNAITNVPQSCSGIFTDAPRLTRVRLSDLSTWQFNWSSLIALELIKPVNNPYLLQALPHMQSLERLLVNQPDNVHYNYIGTGPISLPGLRVLTIFGFGLLPILVSPSLTELYIDVEPYNAGWETAPAVCVSFFQRSSCTIQRLGIRASPTAEITEQILRLTPDLRFLSIHVDDRWQLDLLVPTPGQLPLVPGVQSLRITFPTAFEYFPISLITFLAFRTIHIESQLEELTIAIEDRDGLESTISSLLRVGLDCRQCSEDIQFRIVSPVGPDSDLGRISGEYDKVLLVNELAPQYP